MAHQLLYRGMTPITQTPSAPIQSEPYIFVSYLREDSGFVDAEVKRLEQEGYRVWYDRAELEPNQLWSNVIEDAINRCSCFLVFVTQNAIESKNVLEEIKQALSLDIPFICVEWEETELPEHLREPFYRRQILKRYELRTHEYEEPLRRALSEYAGKPQPLDLRPDVDSKTESSTAWPKAVCLGLILMAGLSFCLAALAAATPLYGGLVSNDPLAKPWLAVSVAFVFLVVAAGLGGGAFAIYRRFLRRRK